MFHAEDMMEANYDKMMESIEQSNSMIKEISAGIKLRDQIIATQKNLIEMLTCLNQNYLKLFKHHTPELYKDLIKDVEGNSNSDH